MNDKYLGFIKLIVTTVLLLISFGVFLHICDNDVNKSNGVGVIWNGKQNIDSAATAEYVAIPGITDLTLVSNKKEQKVNLYNPEQNNCLMSFCIVVNDETIWQGGKLNPGFGYYDIELLKTLSKGDYIGELITRCYSIENETELNGSKMKINIHAR